MAVLWLNSEVYRRIRQYFAGRVNFVLIKTVLTSRQCSVKSFGNMGTATGTRSVVPKGYTPYTPYTLKKFQDDLGFT